MKHCHAAARFYSCPTAGRYLLAAQQAFPNAHVSVQHAYAMHMYARCTNSSMYAYFHNDNAANLQRIARIKVSTLQQYAPYINTCPKVTAACIARWQAYHARRQAAWRSQQQIFLAEIMSFPQHVTVQ